MAVQGHTSHSTASRESRLSMSQEENSSDTETDEEMADCGKCNRVVNSEDNALGCEACKTWFHCGCLKISASKYKLIKQVEDIVRWFCVDCDRKVITAVRKISDLAEKIKSVEEKIETEVASKVEEYMEEKMEREKRRNNLVIFGINEAPEEVSEAQSRKEYDLDVIKNLHVGVSDDLKVDQSEIDQVYRLGRRSTEPGRKPRPLCIKLKTEDKRHQILGSAKKLRDAKDEVGWKRKLFISPDYTIKQRGLQKAAYEELKSRREAGEEGLVIRNFKVVRMRPFREQQDPRSQRGAEANETYQGTRRKGTTQGPPSQGRPQRTTTNSQA